MDGAGLPKELRGGCAHTVSWYSTTLLQNFVTGMRGGEDLAEALSSAIRQTVLDHGRDCDLSLGSPSATFAGWQIKQDVLSYLVLGDASVLLRRSDGTTTEVTDDRLDLVVSPERNRLLALWDRTGEFVGDDAWLEAHRRTAEPYRNVPEGYWVCHTDAHAVDQALRGSVPMGELDGVLLATDGAMRGVNLFREYDAGHLADRLLCGSHEETLNAIRASEDLSAGELTSRRIKVHDDASVISASLRA